MLHKIGGTNTTSAPSETKYLRSCDVATADASKF